jgi:hypothetical protein
MLAANAAQSVFWALSYYLVLEIPVEDFFQEPLLCWSEFFFFIFTF